MKPAAPSGLTLDCLYVDEDWFQAEPELNWTGRVLDINEVGHGLRMANGRATSRGTYITSDTPFSSVARRD